jgi:hypothetical protein
MLEDLDGLLLRGEYPPMVVACPDGICSGRDRLGAIHSFHVDGRGGRSGKPAPPGPERVRVHRPKTTGA